MYCTGVVPLTCHESFISHAAAFPASVPSHRFSYLIRRSILLRESPIFVSSYFILSTFMTHYNLKLFEAHAHAYEYGRPQGIRCETASAYLKRKGENSNPDLHHSLLMASWFAGAGDVSQLSGGIHKYFCFHLGHNDAYVLFKQTTIGIKHGLTNGENPRKTYKHK